jgi:RNA polymerase-associated protein RTF1
MIVSEKQRFKKNPHNYAMKKTHLIKQFELAQLENDVERVQEFQSQLDALEERAKELDARRTNNISAISAINQRNRLRTLEEAVEASKREIEESKNAKADPFTRRQCRPTLVTKAGDPLIKAQIQARYLEKFKMETEAAEAAAAKPSVTGKLKVDPVAAKGSQKESSSDANTADLCSVHNFDININLMDVPTASVNVAPKPIFEPPPTFTQRRSLNLDDYKKKRGLI